MLTSEREEAPVWEQIVERAKKRIPEICPSWTDFNVHDPGMALVELLAWLHEIQMFHMEQISDKHYKKFLKLLGIQRKERRPGRTMVTVSGEKPVLIPAKTAFYAGDIRFESEREQMTAEGIFTRFFCRSGEEETVLSGEWIREGKGVSIRPFGRQPREGAQFIIDLAMPLAERKNWCLYADCESRYSVPFRRVREEAFDGHGFYPLADIRMEYRGEGGWEPVQLLEDETYRFIQSGSIGFLLEKPMSREQPQLRFVLDRCGYLAAPCITRISLAMVLVRQQESQEEERRYRGTGLPDQQFDLQDGFLLEEELKVRVNEILWTRVDDFDCSGPEDGHYQAENGVLRFGDGFHGMIPEGPVAVSGLRRTLGEGGNVKAGAIRTVVTGCPAGEEDGRGKEGAVPAANRNLQVVNEWDVEAGRGTESFESAMKRFLEEREPEERAVSREDYERLIGRIPGLLIEDCRVTGISPERNQLTIAVKPYTEDGEGLLNHAYETNIYRFLEEKRLIGTRIRLVSPDYCRVSLRIEVVGRVEYPDAGGILKEMIREWIGSRTFGEGISYAELYGLVDTHPCVRRVKALRIDGAGRTRRNDLGDLLIPANGLLRLADMECTVLTETERMG